MIMAKTATATTMNVDQFRAAGERAFGYGWQTKMADAFGVNPRTVRGYASGRDPVPSWLVERIGMMAAPGGDAAQMRRALVLAEAALAEGQENVAGVADPDAETDSVWSTPLREVRRALGLNEKTGAAL